MTISICFFDVETTRLSYDEEFAWPPASSNCVYNIVLLWDSFCGTKMEISQTDNDNRYSKQQIKESRNVVKN